MLVLTLTLALIIALITLNSILVIIALNSSYDSILNGNMNRNPNTKHKY